MSSKLSLTEPTRTNGTPRAADLRDRPRYRCGTITLTRLSVTGQPRGLFAWVHDLSATGIGFDVLTALPDGTEVAFQLKGPGEEESFLVEAEVVHSTPSAGFYRVGCRFPEPISQEQLAAILKKVRIG